MTRGWLALTLILGGSGLIAIGCAVPAIRQGSRPYAYVSVMAVGSILAIFGVLLWRDR